MANAIGYIRVSTEEQSADDKYGIETQKRAISFYASENGYEVVKWMIDIISGAKDGRPELDKILYKPDELPAHEAVIVFKNDRIARDTKLYFYYLYVLEKRNVKLISTQEQFAEGDDFANIYRSLLMFVAEQERKNIALRTGKGRSLKARCGGYAGGNKPYGYTVSSGTLVIDPSEEPIVETIFREHDEEKLRWKISVSLYTSWDIRPGKARDFSRLRCEGFSQTENFTKECTNTVIWTG